MFSNQTIFRQFKLFIVAGVYLILGTMLISVPYGIYDLLFGFKGADVGYLGSMLLYIFTGILLTGCIMFFDLLIIRFLIKKKLTNKVYFIIGAISMSLLIAILIGF